MPQFHAMPGDDEVERRLVLDGSGAWPMAEITLGKLPFPSPFVFAGESPERIRRVLAAQAKSFKEALTDRGNVDMEFAHAVIDDGVADGGMSGRFILDDLQGADAGALLAPRAQKQPPVAGGPEQDGARPRQVGLG